MTSLPYNIRPNLVGDYPRIDSTALIDPSAQIIGHVEIARDVFVGPLAVIRADQRGPDGKVAPIRIDEEVNIQDGVIIHTDPGASVTIGPKTSVAHGVTIHGPCTIGRECFLALRSALYKVTLEDHIWLGMGAIAKLVTLPSFTRVPAGSIIRERPEVLGLRLITDEEREYMEDVWAANSRLRRDYLELRNKAESIRSIAEEKAGRKNSA
ncbi:MAG: carbonate dehydratase [Deltaproteobacteria bacterium]|nr:carbonate dehydratase [Deltaproteobacteria bacterium]MCF8120247.1 carbonate dehydratase [Deltaproteobacteria bacterium]